jgi:NADH-quinone oxidoreductase subunit H
MTRAELLADDPLWLIALKVVAVFLFALLSSIIMVWGERRLLGRMQNRPGPNRVGPFGLLQPIADALKLPFKEEIRPKAADKVVYRIAPVVAVFPGFVALSVMPFGPEVSIFGERTVLQLVDLPVGVLVVLAASSIGVYGFLLAGWASGTPYPLLGGLRSAAQVISYEIAMGLSIVAVVLYARSLSTGDIVAAQQDGWYFYLLLPSFLIYLVSMVGETNRAPFDLPEGESELVAGYHTEYSSMKFVMFYIAEYVNMVVVSAFATTLFLGGWMAPWPLTLIGDNVLNTGWWPMLWFIGKISVLMFLFIWLRGALPRFRYDQFMKLGWKILVPFNLVWIVLIAGIRAFRSESTVSSTQVLLIGGLALLILIGLSFLLPERKWPEEDGAPVSGSDYPIPPLDLKVPQKPRRAKKSRRTDRREPVAVTTGRGTDSTDASTSTKEAD